MSTAHVNLASICVWGRAGPPGYSRQQPGHPKGLCRHRADLLSIIWQQEGCICLPLANEYANYSFLLPASGVIFSLSPLHAPPDLYLVCVDYTVAREFNSKRLSGPFSFPRNNFFCLKILLTREKRNQPFPAVWNTDLQNIQKSGGDGFCVFAQNDIKIDLWWVQPLAFPALSLGGIWIREMRWDDSFCPLAAGSLGRLWVSQLLDDESLMRWIPCRV